MYTYNYVNIYIMYTNICMYTLCIYIYVFKKKYIYIYINIYDYICMSHQYLAWQLQPIPCQGEAQAPVATRTQGPNTSKMRHSL